MSAMQEPARYKQAVLGEKQCEFHDTINSTNLRAKAIAREGAAAGSAVFAESQSAGRGRLSRSWMSEPGRGIYMSYITRPRDLPALRSPELSFVAALAVGDTLNETLAVAGSDLRTGLKWPNDVILSGKKVCGILAETALRPDGCVDWAVTGIGINVRGTCFPPELPWATSLEAAAGFAPERAGIALRLLERLAYWTRVWQEDSFERILAECRSRMITLGKRVRAERDGDAIEGEAVDLLPDGSLLLKTAEGMLPLSYGEVSVRGMMGYI